MPHKETPLLLTVSCLQMTSGDDIIANIAACEALVRGAVAQKAELIALPENAFYMRREAHHRDDNGDKVPATRYTMATHPGVLATKEWAKRYHVWILIGSIAVIGDDAEAGARFYNRSVLVNAEGEITACYDKLHLFDVAFPSGEAFVESARVQPGEAAVVAETPWGGLGLTICYDLRFPYLYRSLALAGAKLLSVPAAFTVPTGEAGHWHILNQARAIENGCFVIAPGQCGEHPGGRKSYGHSLIIDPWGKTLADGGEEPGVITATIDISNIEKTRTRIPSLALNVSPVVKTGNLFNG